MGSRQHIEIEYISYESLESIDSPTRELILAARAAAQSSHSPFSHFAVGAAVRLDDGSIVSGFNIESEVFPAGVCAERVALMHAAASHPNSKVTRIAITSLSTEQICYPCGLCRQALLDLERRQGACIEVIMAGGDSAVVVDSAEVLLPFSFKL